MRGLTNMEHGFACGLRFLLLFRRIKRIVDLSHSLRHHRNSMRRFFFKIFFLRLGFGQPNLFADFNQTLVRISQKYEQANVSRRTIFKLKFCWPPKIMKIFHWNNCEPPTFTNCSVWETPRQPHVLISETISSTFFLAYLQHHQESDKIQ